MTPSPRQGLAEILEDLHLPPSTTLSPVGGGSIAHALRFESDGHVGFLKTYGEESHHTARCEVQGLSSLEEHLADSLIRVPTLLGWGATELGQGWLAMEWIQPGNPDQEAWARFGAELAGFHQHTAGSSAQFGGPEDNVIGPLPQANQWAPRWGEFWSERRILPAADEAVRRGNLSQAGLDTIATAVSQITPELDAVGEQEGASLLHGDLWSGNVMYGVGGSGEPTFFLIDPSAYRGHREVDLAMTELFGGFPEAFYRGYRQAWPLGEGYLDRRKKAYQLYPVLVHAILFGGGYGHQAERLAAALLS